MPTSAQPKMLGVYNYELDLWVIVMELMQRSVTHLLVNYKNIPSYVKLSILRDVSRGICYLHSQNPPHIAC